MFFNPKLTPQKVGTPGGWGNPPSFSHSKMPVHDARTGCGAPPPGGFSAPDTLCLGQANLCIRGGLLHLSSTAPFSFTVFNRRQSGVPLPTPFSTHPTTLHANFTEEKNNASSDNHTEAKGRQLYLEEIACVHNVNCLCCAMYSGRCDVFPGVSLRSGPCGPPTISLGWCADT